MYIERVIAPHGKGWTMRLEREKQVVAGCRRFLLEREAATVTEYAVMLAMLISVMVGGISLLGQQVSRMYASVVDASW
jgi:Flp pilus assembly pilin Flp